jgi:hypothetical protein
MSTMWLHHSREKGKRPLDLFSSGYPKQGLLVMTKQRFRECGKANAYSASIEFSVSTHGEYIHGRKAPTENSNIDYQAFFNSRRFAHSRTECLPLQDQIFSAHSLIPEPNVLLTSTQLVCTHASESWLCDPHLWKECQNPGRNWTRCTRRPGSSWSTSPAHAP